MHTEFKLHHVSPERLLSEYVERRLNFALSRFGERIGRVTTRISILSASRSQDLLCRINADLHPFGVVTAEAVDVDVYSAIDRCVSRLARICQSKCARPRSRTVSRSSIRIPSGSSAA